LKKKKKKSLKSRRNLISEKRGKLECQKPPIGTPHKAGKRALLPPRMIGQEESSSVTFLRERQKKRGGKRVRKGRAGRPSPTEKSAGDAKTA